MILDNLLKTLLTYGKSSYVTLPSPGWLANVRRASDGRWFLGWTLNETNTRPVRPPNVERTSTVLGKHRKQLCSMNQDEANHSTRLRLLHFSRYLGEASPCNTRWSAILPSLERAAVLKLFGLDQDSKCIKIHQSKSNQTIHQHTRTAKRPNQKRPAPCRKPIHASSKPENEARWVENGTCFCGHCFPQLTWLQTLPTSNDFPTKATAHSRSRPWWSNAKFCRCQAAEAIVCRSSKGNQREYITIINLYDNYNTNIFPMNNIYIIYIYWIMGMRMGINENIIIIPH